MINENQKLQNIGFAYYIIEEIQDKILAQNQRKYNLLEVTDITNKLLSKQDSPGLIY